MQHPVVKKLAVTAAAVLALGGAASAAEAAARPDDRGARGPGAVAQANAWVAGESVGRPDDRGPRGPGAIEAARREVVLRPDDRGDRRFPGNAPVVQPLSGDTFDWTDAGIGSGATLGLLLLVAGISVVRLRQGAQAA